MNNFIFLYYSAPMNSSSVILFTLIFAVVFLTLGLGIGYFSRINNARIDKFRANVEPLCNWEYSAAEWKHYAFTYNLSAEPVGEAKVKITPLDVWIGDDERAIRKELDANRKCVTDCRLANNILKLRVRWFTTGKTGTPIYSFVDFQLPVPIGKEQEASKVVEFFKNNIAGNGNKISTITSESDVIGLFGETSF